MKLQQSIKKIRTLLSYKVFTAAIYIILGLVIYGALYHNVKPEVFHVELFSVSDKTIRSPKTIEDEEKTEEERKKAENEVEKEYVYVKEKGQNRVSLMTSIFDFISEVNIDVNEEKGENEAKNQSIKEQLHTLKTNLSENVSEDVTKAIPDNVFIALMKADSNELSYAKESVIDEVEKAMNERIREEQVSDVQKEMAEKLAHAPLSEDVKNATITLGQYAIVPNEIYDPELTKEKKKQARESVEPVKILQGQVIVQEGHLIDRETYRQIELLGLSQNNPTVKPFIGLGIFVLLLIGTLYIYFYERQVTEEKKQNDLILTSFIFLIALALMKMISFLEDLNIADIGYIFPAAMAPMLIGIMINDRFALIITTMLAACGSVIFQDDIAGTINIEIAVYILFSGMTSILFLSKNKQRPNILKVGLPVTAVNILIILFLLLIGDGQFTKTEYVLYLTFAIVSAITSAVLTMGLLPFFEAGFGILSTMRLIELSNPNHPLLKKILTDTPGTYHHSVMVANLSEAACEAIDANGLLARVGCYYHDIGKTKRPHFFIENQMNIENPHNHLPPKTSRDIIISHVTDGVEMLKKHKIPKQIIDIAEQHHGTTLLKYFYHKAKEEDDTIEEKDFRYPGPKPQTREAAVISIADSVEAAVRSMSNPTPEQIKELVQNIVQDRLQDEQLNECDITLKELETVKRTFCETLNGIFHSRIEYPDLKKQKVENNAITN